MSTERERQLDEVVTAYLKAVEAGTAPDRAELLAKHPELAADLAAFFAAESQVGRVAAPLRAPVDEPTTGLGEPAPVGPGTRVEYFGDYHLLQEVGRGGMGVVYKARQETLNRTVALKMILSGQLATEADVKRFRAEAEAAARLDHPGIVTVFEVGQHEGQHYFSMAFVEGESLAHRLAQGLLAPREAAELTRKVAEAVAYAHVEGVVHRDLKPANILIDKNGQPRLTDFGLAKRVEGDSGLTATGQILGTPSYMPPEQASGKGDTVGPLADVYSLGAILYCLLTGRPPFQADNPLDTLMQVLGRDPVPPRQLNAAIPRDLETICLKCLEKSPAKRYASAQELVADLGRYLEGRPILARPVGSFEKGLRWCRRNPVVAMWMFLFAFMLVTGTAVSMVQADIASREATRAKDEADKSDKLALQASRLAGEKTVLAEQAKKDADRATASERLMRRHVFSAHTNLAHEAWKSGNVLRAVELLHQHRPGVNEDDLPSFEWGYLWREGHRELRSFALEPLGGTYATTFAISPDGRWIAYGTVRHVYTSRGGDLSTFNAIQLWDVAAGKWRHTFVGKVERKTNTEVPNLQFQELAFSPDSSLFATVTFDLPLTEKGWHEAKNPRVPVYELATLKQRAVIPLPRFVLGDRIAISPDNKTLAAGMTEHGDKVKFPYTLMLWDLPASEQTPAGPGRILRQREPSFTGRDNDGFPRFAFSADGKSLLWNLWADGAVTVTALAGGPDRTWPIQGSSTSIKVSPDGKYVAAHRVGTSTLLLDAKTGKVLHEFNEGAGPDFMYPNAFSPNSKLLAVGKGTQMTIWDVETLKPVGELKGHVDTIRAVGFGADSKTVITVARNKRTAQLETRVWDVSTRPGPDTIDLAANPLMRVHPAYGTPKPHTFKAPDLSPDGKTLAAMWNWSVVGPEESRALLLHDISSGSLGKQLLHLKWDRRDESLTPKFFLPSRVTFSPDGKRMAISSGGPWEVKSFQVWRLEPGADGLKATFERGFLAPQQDTNRVPTAVFSPDGTKLVYGSGPNPEERYSQTDLLHVLDLATGKKTVWPADLDTWFPHAVGLQSGDWMKGRWEGSCNGIVFTSEGKRIISVHKRYVTPWETRIVVWNAVTGEVLSVLESPVGLGYVQHPMALSKDDRMLATCQDDHSIFIWDVPEPALREVRDELKRRAANPEAKSKEPAAKPRVTLRGHAAAVTAMAFHPDGKTLVSASSDNTIKVWDVVTGELRLSLDAHAATSLMFTPDGKTLISADGRGTVKFWRTAPVR